MQKLKNKKNNNKKKRMMMTVRSTQLSTTILTELFAKNDFDLYL